MTNRPVTVGERALEKLSAAKKLSLSSHLRDAIEAAADKRQMTPDAWIREALAHAVLEAGVPLDRRAPEYPVRRYPDGSPNAVAADLIAAALPALVDRSGSYGEDVRARVQRCIDAVLASDDPKLISYAREVFSDPDRRSPMRMIHDVEARLRSATRTQSNGARAAPLSQEADSFPGSNVLPSED